MKRINFLNITIRRIIICSSKLSQSKNIIEIMKKIIEPKKTLKNQLQVLLMIYYEGTAIWSERVCSQRQKSC